MTIPEIYKKYLECTSISTDTRKIENGSLFFALKGPNFNANSFAGKALELGARYVVIDDIDYKKDERYILTKNCLETLQQLALHHRRSLNIPVIAVTGSNGKTTTKELINAVLKTKYHTYATIGNLNNHIGVPLTLLAIKKGVDIAIVEMGANHQKEISFYCSIAEPTHGLITNIGKAHLEGFGGIEGVKKGKGELFEYLYQHGGKAFVNTSDEIIGSISRFEDPITYFQKKDFYHCELLADNPFVVFKGENQKEYSTHLIGKYNFYNIAAALCIGKYFDVPEDIACEAVANYDPQNNRSQIIKKNTNSIILDAYNANPSSMAAAIDNFLKVEAKEKVLIIGDMFELGEDSQAEHYHIGELLNGKNLEIVLCGKEMAHTKNACPKATYLPDRLTLEEWLKERKYNNVTILIKGSRGMGLEKILDYL